MKAGQSFRCLFWAVLYCVLYLVTASEEDLVDFDFDADLKAIDWNYDNENAANEMQKTTEQQKMQPNMLTFDDFEEENQVRPFDWRENVLRSALAKALTHAPLRQKFVEVMPILRVLSSQQRLALSALISAQINARKGQELKLEQVRMMFGDDKKLLLPIVYDIANLVRSSARRYLPVNTQIAAYTAKLQKPTQTPINRRNDVLTSIEETEDDKDIGTIVMPAADDSSLEDFFSKMPDEILDPLSINQELQADATKLTLPTLETLPTITGAPAATTPRQEIKRNQTQSTTQQPKTTTVKRQRRAARQTEFVHKLLRAVPLTSSEDAQRQESEASVLKLNTTNFVGPKEGEVFSTVASTTERVSDSSPLTTSSTQESTQNYQEIEDLAFASLNGTEVELLSTTAAGNATGDEPLPNPEELIAGPRYRIGNKRYAMRPKQIPAKRKRMPLVRTRPKGPARGEYASGSDRDAVVVPKKCERFTASMCIRTEDYPLEQIMGSIRRHKNAMSALLAEYHDNSLYEKIPQAEFGDELEDLPYNRREDDATGGGMCQSIVRYARPQKARSATGEWKYIVNTGQHTQTLRLEKCSNPQESCSYLAQNYRSHCAQIYNYHRLLSWDKSRGLHVDIFKVPTCCSCQVDGYRQQFPPLGSVKSKGFSPAYSSDTYATINEELDYNDEEEEDDLNYNLAHHKLISDAGGYDDNELLLGSKQIRTKVRAPPNPTLGSYLSPPGSDEYAYKQQLAAGNKNLLRRPSYKRPLYNEPRADLDLAPSETHPDKEVNIAGNHLRATVNKRVPQKRQRIYSVPHTATVSTVTTAAAATTGSTTASVSVSAVRPSVAAPHRNAQQQQQANTASTRSVINSYRGGIATNAHQAAAPAQSSYYYTPSGAGHHNHQQLGGGSYGGKSQSRFHVTSGAATTRATSPASTESPQQRPPYQQPAASPIQPSVPLYHVNSIYHGGEYNATTASGSPKRINYSYHPIIDFFENNKYSTSANVASATSLYPHGGGQQQQQQLEPSYMGASGGETLLPHTLPKANTFQVYQSRERRIGFGAGGGVGGGGGEMRDKVDVNAAADFNVEDNVWHPVIVETEVRPSV